MKFPLVFLFLLLLFDGPQGSIISHKRSIRAVNTTLQTNFNGTYQRRNPCATAGVESSTFVASHDFRHYTKDHSSDYAQKCYEIISGFLKAVGNLVRFNNEKNGSFNFRINTSVFQKQDAVGAAVEPGKPNPCPSVPTIVIEATDCEEIDKRGGVPGRKYPSSRQQIKIEELSPPVLSPTAVAQKKFAISPDKKLLSGMKRANCAYQKIQTRENSFSSPTAAQTVTPAGISETEETSSGVFTDIGLNIQTTFEPEQLSDFLRTSLGPDLQQEDESATKSSPDDSLDGRTPERTTPFPPTAKQTIRRFLPEQTTDDTNYNSQVSEYPTQTPTGKASTAPPRDYYPEINTPLQLQITPVLYSQEVEQNKPEVVVTPFPKVLKDTFTDRQSSATVGKQSRTDPTAFAVQTSSERQPRQPETTQKYPDSGFTRQIINDRTTVALPVVFPPEVVPGESEVSSSLQSDEGLPVPPAPSSAVQPLQSFPTPLYPQRQPTAIPFPAAPTSPDYLTPVQLPAIEKVSLVDTRDSRRITNQSSSVNQSIINAVEQVPPVPAQQENEFSRGRKLPDYDYPNTPAPEFPEYFEPSTVSPFESTTSLTYEDGTDEPDALAPSAVVGYPEPRPPIYPDVSKTEPDITADVYPPQTDDSKPILPDYTDELSREIPPPQSFLPYSNQLRGGKPSTTLSPYASSAAAVAFFQQSPRKPDIQSESLISSNSRSREFFPQPTTPSFPAIARQPLAADGPITSVDLPESVPTVPQQPTATLNQFPSDSTVSSVKEFTFRQPTPPPLVDFPEEQQQTFPKPISSRPKPVAFKSTPDTSSPSAVYDQQTSPSDFPPEQQPENFTPEPSTLIPQPELEVIQGQQPADSIRPPIYRTTTSDVRSLETYQSFPVPEVIAEGTTFPQESQPTAFSEFDEVPGVYQPTAASVVTPPPVDQQPTGMEEFSEDFSTTQPSLGQTFPDFTRPKAQLKLNQEQADSELFEPPSMVPAGGNDQPFSVGFQPSSAPESQTETTSSYSDDRKPSFQTPLELPPKTVPSSTESHEFQTEDSVFTPIARSPSPVGDAVPVPTAVENPQPLDASSSSQSLQIYNQFPPTPSYEQPTTNYYSSQQPTADYDIEDTTASPPVFIPTAPPQAQLNPQIPKPPENSPPAAALIVDEEIPPPVHQQNFQSQSVREKSFQSPSFVPEPQPQPSLDSFPEILDDKPTNGPTETSTTFQNVQSQLATTTQTNSESFPKDGAFTKTQVQQQPDSTFPIFSEDVQQGRSYDVQTADGSSFGSTTSPIQTLDPEFSVLETSKLVDDVLPTADQQSSPAGKPEPQMALKNSDNISPHQQYLTTTPTSESDTSVGYNRFSETGYYPADGASTPETFDSTTKTVETYEQEVFTTDAPQQFQTNSQNQVNSNRQQQPFYYSKPSGYPNSNYSAFYDQSTARRLPEYNVGPQQRQQDPRGFYYPQQVSNFSGSFPQPQGEDFGRNSFQPTRLYDQQQNYRMTNLNFPPGHFANQFNRFYPGGQPNGPLPDGYNPREHFDRYQPTPQEFYANSGRSYDERNVPSDSFVRNQNSFEQTRSFNDARQLQSHYGPQRGPLAQGQPPIFDRNPRGPQMFQQENGQFMASPQIQPSPFINHPNARESSLEFHRQTQPRFFPSASYLDNSRRGFPSEDRQNFEPQGEQFHPQAAALVQSSSFSSYPYGRRLSSANQAFMAPPQTRFPNPPDNRQFSSNFHPYSDREFRDVQEQQSRPFLQSSPSFDPQNSSPNFYPQPPTALMQSPPLASYTDRREFSPPVAPPRDFKTSQTDLDKNARKQEPAEEPKRESPSLSLVSSAEKYQPSRDTETKIVEEIITTDFPKAMTESPVETQLAYADKLLNDDTTTAKNGGSPPQSGKPINQQQQFKDKQVEEQLPQRRSAGPNIPQQQQEFDPRQQTTPDSEPQYSLLQFPNTPANFPDNVQQRVSLDTPNESAVPSVPNYGRNFLPPEPVGVPGELSEALVSEQTTPSNTPDLYKSMFKEALE